MLATKTKKEYQKKLKLVSFGGAIKKSMIQTVVLITTRSISRLL